MWGMFIFVVGLWTIATLILNYHWKTYGVEPGKVIIMKYVYFIGSTFFLAVIFLATLTFALS